jgi:hypothetical protein
MTVLKELSKCKSNLVGVQEVRWDRGGTERAGEYTFFYRKGNENHESRTGFFVQKKIMLVVQRVESVSDRMSYIIPSKRLLVRNHCFECSCPNRV